MEIEAVPDWTAQGVLPPVDLLSTTSVNRSPYHVSLKDVVLRFAVTDARRSILDGFLRHRAALHAIGLTKGFQWLNGSFLEQIETLESRDPNDIDVVTFYKRPPDLEEQTLLRDNAALFTAPLAKTEYGVDAYFVNLDLPSCLLVRRSAYWYSLWAHRRSWTWKGYLEVNLSPEEDAAARALLQQAQGTQR